MSRGFSAVSQWLADPETCSAVHRKLIQMGLWEQDRDQLRITPLGKELDVELFHVFLGVRHYYEVPLILEEYGLLSESEFYTICASDVDAETLLSGYVKRAYFDYRKAAKLCSGRNRWSTAIPTLTTNHTTN